MSKVVDINWLYNKYYKDNPELRRVILIHSEQVAKKALSICKNLNLPLDKKEVYCAAMLHDIGVVKCHAPGIHAHGKLPYLQHGLAGKEIMKKAGLPLYARICSCHTGAGISKEEIIERNLPLPKEDFLPQTLLEKLICYADKFYSKSGDLQKEKPLEEVLLQMKKFGESSLSRFQELHSLFNPPSYTQPHQ